MNLYQGSFSSICPSDGAVIRYEFSICSRDTILVEDVIKVVEGFKSVYHETAADTLFDEFGGSQIIKATHQGVKITTIRE